MKKFLLSLICIIAMLTMINSTMAEESDYPNIPWQYIDGENGLGELIFAQGKYITAGYDGIKYSYDLEQWHTAVTVSEDQYIHGGWPAIEYNGEIFIVTGLSGGIYHSADGIEWSFYERPFDFDISEIIWDGKQFVAVGQYGRDEFDENSRPAGIITSVDGLEWKKLDVHFDFPWGLDHIAYNGSVYVVDEITEIYYSYDLINWEKSDIDYGYNEGIEWVKDRFVATRGNKNILYSYDGIEWNVIDQSWGNTMSACAYNGNIFVSVGSDATIYVSYDGLNWICKTEWHATENHLYDIIWTGERFVILGNKNNLTWIPDDIIKVRIDDEYLITDVAPVISNDRTLLPVRAVAQSLSASVAWDDASKTATITKGETNVQIEVGKSVAKVNGTDVEMDVAAIIHNDRIMLPVRFISEALDFGVEWDESTKTVVINSRT